MATIAELQVRIGADLTDLQKKLNDAQTKLSNFGDDMQALGTRMTAALTLPILGAGTAAVKSSIDFETAFAGVRKTVDATEDEFADLRQGILDMSKELPASAGEIANVAESAGQLGISTENILEFSRTMINLGETTNLTAEEAAVSFARLANIMQTPQDEFDKLGSVVVDLGNNMATTEAEITEMALRLAGSGKQIGLTESDVLALSASLTSVGINAEAGGTAFSRLFVEMDKAVEEGGDTLAKFAQAANVSTSDFSQMFESAPAQAIQTFIEGLSTVEDRGGSLNSVLEDLGVENVRISDALKRTSGAGDLLGSAFEIANAAFDENTALINEAQQRYDTLASQLSVLKNRVEAVSISIGDKLAPKMTDIAESLVEWFEGLQDMNPKLTKFFVIVAGLAAVIGPVALAISAVIALMNPWAVAIAAVVAVAGLVITNWEDIKTWLDENMPGVTDAVKEAFDTMAGDVSSEMEDIKSTINDAWDDLVDTFSEKGDTMSTSAGDILQFAIDLAGGLIGNAFDAIGAMLDQAVILAETALGAIGEVFNIFTSLFEGDWEGFWDGIKGFFGTIWDGIKDTFENALDAIFDLIPGGDKLREKLGFNTLDDALADSETAMWNFKTEAEKAGDQLDTGNGSFTERMRAASGQMGTTRTDVDNLGRRFSGQNDSLDEKVKTAGEKVDELREKIANMPKADSVGLKGLADLEQEMLDIEDVTLRTTTAVGDMEQPVNDLEMSFGDWAAAMTTESGILYALGKANGLASFVGVGGSLVGKFQNIADEIFGAGGLKEAFGEGGLMGVLTGENGLLAKLGLGGGLTGKLGQLAGALGVAGPVGMAIGGAVALMREYGDEIGAVLGSISEFLGLGDSAQDKIQSQINQEILNAFNASGMTVDQFIDAWRNDTATQAWVNDVFGGDWSAVASFLSENGDTPTTSTSSGTTASANTQLSNLLTQYRGVMSDNLSYFDWLTSSSMFNDIVASTDIGSFEAQEYLAGLLGLSYVTTESGTSGFTSTSGGSTSGDVYLDGQLVGEWFEKSITSGGGYVA